ncbi:MAG TPA: hypothetical protein ENK84_08055 [Desulfobulbus sp.]|nr:hypothetical protein [Desulfobulbus sp.]
MTNNSQHRKILSSLRFFKANTFLLPTKFYFFIFFCLILFSTIQGSSIAATAPVSLLQAALTRFLENQPTVTLDLVTTGMDPTLIDQVLFKLYREHGMQPLWLVQNTNIPTERAQDLREVLQNSFEDGLNPDDYKVAEILTLWEQSDISSRVRLDVLLTMVLGRYVADMREGSADPCLLDPKLFAAARDKEVDLFTVVQNGLNTPNIKEFLRNQAPTHSDYTGLRKALAQYRTMRAQGEWDNIPTGTTIRTGMTDPRLPLICNHLQRSGDLASIPDQCTIYTHEMETAVKKFQQRFQLEPDGVIGKKTLAALNIPISQLIRKIILNMERWRWLPHRLNGKRIFVNIAGFQLFGATDEQVQISMPVIVGKKYHETPVFTGMMKYLVINPYWNIPDSIAVKEIVPHMIRNPNYLREKHIRIFRGWSDNAPQIDPATINWRTIGKGIKRYRLRQDAGPTNALGRIKFIFPNPYHVYLHDTPTRQLFKRSNRSFSHGCIRVSRPLALAVYVLKDMKKQLDKEQLQQLIDTGKRKVILLDKRIPVHILYRTVRVAPEGMTFFYPDIYGRDALLARALFARKPLSQCRYPQ